MFGGIMKFKEIDTLGHILQSSEKAEDILLSFGMHCLYCPCSQMETLKEACEVHGVNVKEVLKALNA